MRYLLLLAPMVLLAGPARYARVGEMSGAVDSQAGAAESWIVAERNAPLPQSARVRTGPASRVEIELDEGSAVRLGPNTELELSDQARLSTGQRVTLLSVLRGVAYVSGAPEGRDSLAIALPGAQVAFTRSSRVRIEVEEQWSQIAVLKGAARFSSPAADLELREGQTTRVEPANPARFFFYKEVLPGDLDQWSQERDDALMSPSAAHTIQRYGLADLDGTGEWILTPELGAVWRPKADENWRPYRDGHWRWYDGLGYTWIAAEPWGWLPYHYGRWTRFDNLGWVWAPSKNGVFKPGDVYWMRGPKFVGWGPLAPGEQWDPTDEVNAIPQQFLHANTTYAPPVTAGRSTIDSAGFKTPPKDPLKEGDFLTAMPSPRFEAAKLEAVRPLVIAAAFRVKPVIEQTHVEPAAPQRPPAAAPAPVVIATQTAPAQPAPPPEIVEVPVPVPAGIVYVASPRASREPVKPQMPAPPASRPQGRRVRQYRTPAEAALIAAIVQKLERRAYEKALVDLEQWTSTISDTDFAPERTYYYMLAFNGLEQPAKVVSRSSSLLARPIRESMEEPLQALSVAYLTTTNYLKIQNPDRGQSNTARIAAREMLSLVPECFTADGKPQTVSAADWAKSRTLLETIARETLSRSSR